MFCSLITDFIPVDVKCGECLCDIMSMEQVEWVEVERDEMLLCFVEEHWLDVLLLDHPFDSRVG